MKLRIIQCAALLVSLCGMSATHLTAQSSVAALRASHLRHGINASGWFGGIYDKRGNTKEHFEAWTTAEDMALITAMGFDNVRLSLNPVPMMPHHRPDEIPADYQGYLDAAIKMILDHGLAVVIDIHPDSDFKAKLSKDDSFVQEFADFWRALARHYSTWDQDRVFFEILNEPEMSDRYRWAGVQTKLAAAIREGAPQHTIIAAGARWSDDDDLVSLQPLQDPNIIYNFHFYDPHIFTHQGATWGAYYWHWVKGLHYPSSLESAAKTAAGAPDPVDRLAIIRYGEDHWDAARIDTEMTQVAEWAHQHDVPVVCNEFGVFREGADSKDREAWIHDVRTAFERHGIGWAMWDYSGNFGVVTKKDGQTLPDESTVRALGLKMPSGK
jgi:aryl-phospho-beta-D-glucosidase BglC (GH1 family)